MLRWIAVLVYALVVPIVAEGRGEKTGRAGIALNPLVRVLIATDDVAVQRDVLRGMHEALEGRRNVKAPANWATVYRKLAASTDSEVREKALILSVLFGDPVALESLRKMAADRKSNLTSRRTALQTLVEKRAEGVLPLLRILLTDRALRAEALRGFAAFNDPATPALILSHYSSFSEKEKVDAIGTLASRPAYAEALLDAMEKGKVPRRDLSAFLVRQMVGFNDKRLTEKLGTVWGSIRPLSKEKVTLLRRFKALVTRDALQKANRPHGRQLFARNCASCHMLFNEGGKVGPDLTGSQRANPEYIFAKVLDPNAVVARDYQVTIITTTNGRVINGIVKTETAKTITLQTQNETILLPKAEVEERRRSPLSMMPEGMLTPMTDTEVRDLIAYLSGAEQVPLPRK